MTGKHTPGPWRVIPRDGKFANAVQRGREGGFEVRGLDNETEDADARLIAASPELLEKLARLIAAAEYLQARVVETRGANCMDNLDFAIDEAKKAIAKATGEGK